MPFPTIEPIGKRFHNWTILGKPVKRKGSNYLYPCRCNCGHEKLVEVSTLRHRQSKHCRKCSPINLRGEKSINWKTGRSKHKGCGYWTVLKHSHPNADKNGRVYEHIFIMAEHLGRPIKKYEIVHHKNGDRSDNRLCNLELWIRKDPPGQRVSDKINYAVEILTEYAPTLLK